MTNRTGGYTDKDAIAFRNRFLYHVAGIPIVGDMARAFDSDAYMSDYLHNRGFDWSNLNYPTMNKGAGAGGNVASSLWHTSEKSLKSLYADNARSLRNEHYKRAIKANNMRMAWYYSRM